MFSDSVLMGPPAAPRADAEAGRAIHWAEIFVRRAGVCCRPASLSEIRDAADLLVTNAGKRGPCRPHGAMSGPWRVHARPDPEGKAQKVHLFPRPGWRRFPRNSQSGRDR